MKYHKINSIFKRDNNGRLIEGEFSIPEFEYLQNNIWVFTEKVDGTNIRVYWDRINVRFRGRTDNAQMPTFLYDKLVEKFTPEKFQKLPPLVLYGEGYGNRIQKCGHEYIKDGVDFILFDVFCGSVFLKRGDVEDIGNQLSIDVVPIVDYGTIWDAIGLVQGGLLNSQLKAPYIPEGLVLRPQVELKDRGGGTESLLKLRL